ncbi:hypothetical protein QBC45DRAFT_374500 [Copromyces sp. CBS 386.78]|nr:hypothetical protein QBC45DRAFT_374500 [Copromyces sp. CBS 386.78]
MNQNREQQSPTAEAQSPATDGHNGQSTTTPEVEDRLFLDHHHPHQEEHLQSQHQHQHLPQTQPEYVESEFNFGSDKSTDVEYQYPIPNPHAGKNEIFIKEEQVRITTTITTVKLVTIRKITKRKDGIYKGPKVTTEETHIAGPHTQSDEVTIGETESGWITDKEAEEEDEGDKTAPPSGDDTTAAAGSSPSSANSAGN